MSGTRRPHARFELAHDLPFPVSVAVRDGEIVVLLQDGAVVDASLVTVLNDLLRDDE